MRRLLIAGIVYLVGMAVILITKPSFMFNSDGNWKEFGIGRNPATHTILPVWLFAVLWALLSYLLVSLLFLAYKIPARVELESAEVEVPLVKARKPKAKLNAVEIPDGYYVLNAKATEEAGGVPKYIFLGKGLPDE
jgi:hypothetical protein